MAPKYTLNVEQKGTGSDKREDDACWGLFACVRNIAARGSLSSCLSQSPTGYDASLSKEEIPSTEARAAEHMQENRKLRIEKIEKIGKFVLKNKRKIGKSIVLSST